MPQVVRLFAGDAGVARDIWRPNPLLRAWWKHEGDRDLSVAIDIVDDPHRADAVMLPSEWRQYRDEARLAEPAALARAARTAGVPLLVFEHTDAVPKIPFPETVLFHPGPHKSVRRPYKHVFALPAFVREQLLAAGGRGHPANERRAKPVVGFVGHARLPKFGDSARARVGGTIALLRQFRSTRHAYELTMSPVKMTMRARVLQALRDSDDVTTSFVLRTATSSGANAETLQEQHFAEFRENLITSDYALCTRGLSNYSYRLSEALCFGRVPLCVMTDNVLPFEFAVNWNDHAVLVDLADVADAGRRTRAHYDATSPEAMEELSRRNHALFKDRLTLKGFLNHFPEFLDRVAGRK